MTEQDDSAPSRKERMRAVLEEAYGRLEAGEFPDIGALCADDPALLSDVMRVFAGEELVVRTFGDLRPDDATSLPARRLGEFRLVSLLGSGGMGRVYLAEQESLGRMVALKVLDPATTADPKARVRFRREAEIAGILDHPNIVPVFGVGEDKGLLYIAMKWLTGPSLESLAAPLDHLEVARIGRALAEALHEAHSSGVLHRDIKPANVLMDGATPYLVDFGLARARTDVTLTEANAAPGTLLYMSPELLSGDAPRLDLRADIYALGVTLYELVAGRPPFDAREPERLMHRILFKDPPQLGLRGRARDLETIIFRAMDKNPDRRFQSAQDLADDLGRYVEDLPIRSVPLSRLTRTWRMVMRHRRAAAIVGVLIAIVLASLVMLFASIARERSKNRETLSRAAERARLGAFDESAALLRTLSDDSDEKALLEQELRLRVILDETLDLVQTRDVGIDLVELDEHLAVLESADVAGLDREARSHVHLALCLGRWIRGRSAAAKESLARLESLGGTALCVAALRELLLDQPASSVRPTPAENPDDGVFYAVIQRLLRRPISAQRREVEAVLARWPSHFRARLLVATLDAHESKPGLIRVFQNLLRNGRHPKVVLRQLLRLSLIDGDIDAARRLLARRGLSEAIIDRSMDLWFLWRSGAFDEFDHALAQQRAEFGRHEEFDIQELRARHAQGDLVAMRGLVEDPDRFTSPTYRAEARLVRDELAMNQLYDEFRALEEDEADLGLTVSDRAELAAQKVALFDEVRTAGERLLELRSDLDLDAQRARVLIVLARGERILGNRRGAARFFLEALALWPDDIVRAYVTIFASALVDDLVSGKERSDVFALMPMISAGLASGAILMDRMAPNATYPIEYRSMLKAVAQIAIFFDDSELLARAVVALERDLECAGIPKDAPEWRQVKAWKAGAKAGGAKPPAVKD